MKHLMGIDVGSTTAKMVVMSQDGQIEYTNYQRHNARVNEVLSAFLNQVRERIGNDPVTVHVTGSVGMATAEQLKAGFVQEVVAATRYVREKCPQTKALIDIGGEDSKIVLFNGRNTDLRMNGNCAGGTGAFIDQMSALLGITNQELSQLAEQSTHLVPIASRCGVFAKTDVQNLVSRNVPRPDIAASIFHSIAVQTVTTLAHGCTIEPPILLCGGPFTYLPALRQAFARYMGLDGDQLTVPEHGNLIPAMGSALHTDGPLTTIAQLLECLKAPAPVTLRSSQPRLFNSQEQWQAWRQEKAQFAVAVQPMRAHEQVVIGIDSGSTTTKVVAARPDGQILFTHYAQSKGNPIQAAIDGLNRLKQQAQQSGTTLEVVGSCSTGYGEQLIKAALGLDEGIIETMAHYYGANRLKPGVTFILDIGGQDMKAIFVENGVIKRMELNEACSSGCGTFLQTFASSLGYEIGDFAHLACTAQHPCDLGTRCTVFMNSKIKQVLREGADVADISAGLCYSVVNNCLFKVLKLKKVDEMGDKIVVQGGTMRNDGVVRALELLTGRQVARSDMPEMMGAYGCALHAARHLTAPRSIDQMLAVAHYETSQLHCKGCENQCAVLRYKFGSGQFYYSGNKCERVFNNSGHHVQRGRNIYQEKYRLLFNRPVNHEAQRKIGIPRVLNTYEEYPFWHRLLTDCGFEVVLSGESRMNHYEQALHWVMSDNICFPAKLAHSHIAQLDQLGLERILMPYVVFERNDSSTAINSYNCPIVSGYSDVIRSAMDCRTPIDSPAINFGNRELLRHEVTDYLHTLGIDRRTARKAFEAACQAQDDYEQELRRLNLEILEQSRAAGQITLLLAGRPYHTDPLIQHRLSEMVAGMGVNVMSDDVVRHDPAQADGQTNTVRQWAFPNRIIKAAQWAAEQGSDVQFVEMTSFGCGPDAFIQDEVRDLLSRRGKTLTLLKIDDVSNLGSLKLRVRSLIESLQQHTDAPQQAPFLTTRTFKAADRHRKLIVPYMSEYITPLLTAFGSLVGYDIEVLPASDAESGRLGLQYANNEVCYPATLIVGDIIKALKSGKYDPSEVAVGMTQTGGQCRATNYAGLIKRAMVQAGFADVPLVTVGVSDHAGHANEQEAFDFSWRKLAPVLIIAMLYADTVAKFFYATLPREREAGLAARLRDKYLEQGARAISTNNSDNLMWLIATAATEFDQACLDHETDKVGIVGEIFLKFNHFAHQNVVDQLSARGLEVLPPLITPFFLQNFVNNLINKRLKLRPGKTPAVVVKMLYALVSHRVRKVNKIASSRFRYFVPFTDIFKEAEGAKGIVSPAAQFGEGWLLPAEIVEMCESGVKNVVSLQPFGCIANHIVAKGITRALARRYPDINLLTLDFDSGVSSVNVTNRLLLFASQCHQTIKN